MEIAFVTPAYYPSMIGASYYCQDLAGYLREKGNKVTVYTKINEGWKSKEIVNGTEINRLPVRYFFGKKVYYSSSWAKLIAERKFDVIHSHHYGYFPASAGLAAAKISKKPHVFGPYYHPPVYGFFRSLQFAAYNGLAGRPLLAQSDMVLPHTEFEKKKLLEIGAVKRNMEILPNTVNTKIFRSRGKKENVVLFVSSVIRDKGADVAMQMLHEISRETDIQPVFIGRHYDEKLHPMIRRMKNSGTRFIDAVGTNELVRWYSRASAVILPSKYEAFSRVLAEAQACGTPVVATRVGGIPEVVEDGRTGFLVDYGDWKNMAEKVRLLLDRKTSRKMGAAGSKHVRKSFDTEVVGKKLVSIYKKVV